MLQYSKTQIIELTQMGNVDLLLQRIALRPKYTIGKLYLNGVYFCDTIEDTVRDFKKDGSGKIYGETAIPYGKYRIKITWSQRFNKPLPLLLNVPFFNSIRIHGGNTEKDTHGCILVGKNKVVGKVIESQITLKKLMLELKDKNNINIEII
jgi:hypothetical protein